MDLIEETTKSKQRSANWSREEITALIDGYRRRINIIDGRLTPALTMQTKAVAYTELVAEVNAVGTCGRRTLKQVKKKLEDQRSRTREKAAKIHKHRTATGGGPPSDILLLPHEEILLSLINPQLVEGILETDGDSSIPKDTSREADTTIEEIDDSELKTNANHVNSNHFQNNLNNNQHAMNAISDGECWIEIASTPKSDTNILGLKRKRLTEQIDAKIKVTSNQAEEMLDIERKKLDLNHKLFELKRLKLQVLFKQMKRNGEDVAEEEKELKCLKF